MTLRDEVVASARAAGATVEDLRGPCRERPVVAARRAAAAALRRRGLSYPAIAEQLGRSRCSHTSAIGWVRAFGRDELAARFAEEAGIAPAERAGKGSTA